MSFPLPHLVRRFFGVVAAGRLGPAEQSEVTSLLRREEYALFWRQPPADQRHALECARLLLARRPARRDLARAALLHDVGKRHAGLGALGRSLATTLAAFHLPRRGRLAAYLAHGPAGADELAAAGAEAIVVTYARHHHSGRPPGVDESDWQELCRADHA